ncbi:MAG: DUF58 domain-containing protein [Verrucomicrobiae bacterium]|nr:DUF58 domain-containing protein [Verrucomicrobiae bacterium]
MWLWWRVCYGAYRLFSAARTFIDRRLTRIGVLAAAGLAASAALGIDTNVSVTYQVFSMLAGCFAVGLAYGLTFHPRFRATRRLPRFGTAGEPLEYTLAVENLRARPARGLGWLEKVADPKTGLREFIERRELGGPDETWWRREVRAFSVRNRRSANIHPGSLPPLPASGRVETPASLLPLRRGYLHFQSLSLTRTDPLGLWRSAKDFQLPQSVLILPRRYPVPPLRLAGRRSYQPGGVALSGAVGESEEFVGLRDYRPGDPPRRIHWKSWAKTGRPIVRECEDEFFVRYALVLDTFSGNRDPQRFEDAVSVAASFACAVDTQETLLDLMFVGNEAFCFTAGRGVAPVEKMLEVLACAPSRDDENFGELDTLVERHLSLLSGCMLVLLDWDERRRRLVERLSANGVPILAVVMTHEKGGPLQNALAGDAVVRAIRSGHLGEDLLRL